MIQSTIVKTELQRDLDALVDRANTWQLHFNSEKCKVLHMGKNNEQRCYKIRKHGSSDRVTLEQSEIEGSGCSGRQGLKIRTAY